MGRAISHTDVYSLDLGCHLKLHSTCLRSARVRGAGSLVAGQVTDQNLKTENDGSNQQRSMIRSNMYQQSCNAIHQVMCYL